VARYFTAGTTASLLQKFCPRSPSFIGPNRWKSEGAKFGLTRSLGCQNSISTSLHLPTPHFIALRHWGVIKDAPVCYGNEKCTGVSCEIPASLTPKLTCTTSILFKSWYTKSILISSSHQLLGRLWRGSPPLKPRIVHSSTPLAAAQDEKLQDHTRTKDCRGVLRHALLLGDIVSAFDLYASWFQTQSASDAFVLTQSGLNTEGPSAVYYSMKAQYLLYIPIMATIRKPTFCPKCIQKGCFK
jgi:hypothetical protein